jgi:putative membrane protein
MSNSPPRRSGTTNELAKERNRAAAERTLNAWVGTCLTLISFGVASDQIFQTLRRRFPGTNPAIATETSTIIGMVFVGVALVLLLIALVQHQIAIKTIEQETYVQGPVNTLNRLVVAAILLVGAAGFLITLLFL